MTSPAGQEMMLALAAFGVVWALTCVGGPHRARELVAPQRPDRSLTATFVTGGLLLGCVVWVVRGAAVHMAGLVILALICTLAARRLLGERTVRRLRRERQLAVIGVCDALAAELTAGLSTTRAVERAFAAYNEWTGVVTAVRVGGDVVAALRHAADHPGAEGLRAVAAGWEIAGRSGSALATVLDRIAAGLRSDDEARCEVAASLGPPRATARLLAMLPIFGLLLGTSMGARPVAFLLTTSVGLACLVGGVVLALAGLFWVEQLASAAEL